MGRTALHFELPEDSPLTIHEGYIQWPEVVTVEVGFVGVPIEYGVFSDKSVIYVPITVAPDAAIELTTLLVRPVFQACDDISCLLSTPTNDMGATWDEYGISVELNIIDPSNASISTQSSTFDSFDGTVFPNIHKGIAAPTNSNIEFDAFGISFSLDADGPIGLILLLVVAMGGGFLLNLTPCVLPVIPIKIMGLSNHAGTGRDTFILGVWMMFGVMALWLALGAAISVISGFTAINQLFQYPAFTIVLGLFIGMFVGTIFIPMFKMISMVGGG